ncbi:MAG: tyrosinase family protein, partial [Candidatus Dormibacteraeota bacterium]|nr:tyrosinase family protein [Candidatus Dormibacteraeota bacterium]
CAAQDPVFWLHHSNIDRLWKHWQLQGGGRANPTEGAWLDQAFRLYDEQGKAVTMTPRDVLDTEQLGYRYDDEAQAVTAAAATVMAAMGGGNPQQVMAASTSAAGLSEGQTEVALVAEEPEALRTAAARPAERRRWSLTVEDVQMERHPGVVYEIYLNRPTGLSEEQAEPYFVGYVTFFGASHMAHHGGGAKGPSHTYDITQVVQRLSAAGSFDPERLVVTFQPADLLPPPGQEPSAPSIAPGAGVVIERITIAAE